MCAKFPYNPLLFWICDSSIVSFPPSSYPSTNDLWFCLSICDIYLYAKLRVVAVYTYTCTFLTFSKLAVVCIISSERFIKRANPKKFRRCIYEPLKAKGSYEGKLWAHPLMGGYSTVNNHRNDSFGKRKWFLVSFIFFLSFHLFLLFISFHVSSLLTWYSFH